MPSRWPTDQGHSQIEPLHLLEALLNETDGVIAPLLERIGANRAQLEGIVRTELQRLPKVSGGSPPQPSSELVRVLETAQREADAMKDEFVSTEHLLLALTKVDSKAKNILKLNALTDKELLQAMQAVRGSQRVTDQNPEAKFQALERYGIDLIERARQGKLDPVIGRDQEIRRVIQVLSRRTKNNPVLDRRAGRGQDGHRRGPGPADRRRRRAREPRRTAASSPWTWARWWPARSSAASSRSGSRPS